MAADEFQRSRFDHVFLARLFIGGVLVIGLGSWLAGMEVGEVRLIPCLFTTVTSYNCPGCGMTRSCLSLARGNLVAAWQFNPFALLLVPIAAAYAIWPRQLRDFWQRLPVAAQYMIGGICLMALLLRWFVLLK